MIPMIMTMMRVYLQLCEWALELTREDELLDRVSDKVESYDS